MAFAVVIHEKGGQPRRQEFSRSEVTIGRVQGNDIVLPKQNVSKRHSRIVLKNGKFVITDLKSTNGTYVNGRKISTPAVIKETDKIYIGDFVLSTETIDGESVELSAAATPPPPPPPASSSMGVRPPFAGGMPAQTIASGMSPFSSDGPPPAPATPPSSPFGGIIQGADDAGFNASTSFQSAPPSMEPISQPPAPPPKNVAPPVAVATPLVPPPSSPAPMNIAPTPPTPAAPSAPAVTPVAPPAPVAPSAPAISSAPLAPPVARPLASAPVARSTPSQLNDELDLSVIDGGDSNSSVMQLHISLQRGLEEKGMTLPSRYRPGQQLNPALLNSALDILQNVKGDHSSEAMTQVIDEALSIGALHALVEDASISTIYLNGAHHLAYTQAGKMSVMRSPFSSVEQARRAARRILNGLGASQQNRGEGRLGELRAYVDVDGSEGPYICLQRSVNQRALGAWVESQQFDHQVASAVTHAIRNGAKIAIASRDTQSQVEVASAIALSCLKSRRVISVGLQHHLGNESAWLTMPGEMDALMTSTQLTPECLIIADQASFDGTLVFESLSATSSGVLLITARSTNAAVQKLNRRALDAELVTETLDLLLMVERGEDGVTRLSEVYSFGQQQTVYSGGVLNGSLI
jgi:predicted component of type VI protein secretion system